MSYFKMSRMAIRWALSKPVTTRYPFEPRQMIQGSRGSLTFDAETCVFCGVCAKKCPTGALAVIRQTRKWSIDRLLCITCGACIDICPKKSLSLETQHMSPTITKDRECYSGSEKPALAKAPASAPAPVA